MKIIQVSFLSWIVLLGLVLPGAAFAQRNAPLQHTWMLTSGGLDHEEMHFTRIDNPEQFEEWADTFAFDESGTLTYKLTLPGGRPICGNGLFYLDEASYHANRRNKRVRIRAQGGHFLYDTFTYDVTYKVLLLNETEMVLRRKRVREAVVSPEFDPETSAMR